MSYNGWTNYETWLVGMWYGDVFADMASDGTKIDGEMLENFVTEMMADEGSLPETGFAADIMNAALCQVDWNELAEHYKEDSEDEDEEEMEDA